jgi:hypothetical protein
VGGDVIEPTITNSGGVLAYAYKKRNDDPNLSYTVEICTDLTDPDWIDTETTPEPLVIGAEYNDVKHTI